MCVWFDMNLTVGVGAVVLVPRLHDDGVGPLEHRGRLGQRSAPRTLTHTQRQRAKTLRSHGQTSDESLIKSCTLY